VQLDPSVLTWKDWILVGVIIGQALAARGRRFMGERVGAVERAVLVIAKSAGVELDPDSNPDLRPRLKRKVRDE